MARELSGRRKFAFYVGTAVQLAGLGLFISTFFYMANAGQSKPLKIEQHLPQDVDWSHLRGTVPPGERIQSILIRALGGMAVMVIGVGIRTAGARGWAGSGMVLAPDQARQELEPYSRMAGGMIKDALNEAGIGPGGKPEKIIMIKCRQCGKLNEEDSNFCQECGTKI